MFTIDKNATLTELGIIGSIIGDALGTPVELYSRAEILQYGIVKGMTAGGEFDVQKGEWGDDGGLTLATYDSLSKGFDLTDMMNRYADWYLKGDYTPYGEAIDVGPTIIKSINKYKAGIEPKDCGEKKHNSSGNGSLLRIFPACMYAIENDFSDEDSLIMIHSISALSHGSTACYLACTVYYFVIKEIVNQKKNVITKDQLDLNGVIRCAFANVYSCIDLMSDYFNNLPDFHFRWSEIDNCCLDRNYNDMNINTAPEKGYVYDTLVTVIWCLLSSRSFQETVLKAANIHGSSYASIAGGLAAVWYGIDSIPLEWIAELKGIDVINQTFGRKVICVS